MSVLIKNIGELFDGHRVMKDTCIFIEDGRIVSVGQEERADEVIDARKKLVMPGFIDPHTHAVFAGYRAFEIEWKTEGLSYQEIARKGGGIGYTVRKTREASAHQLKRESLERLQEMLQHGTTTAEIKSGYGLDTKNELKMLEVINEFHRDIPMDIVPTFLAHAIPEDVDPDEFVQLIVEEMLPEIGERKLARFCDVFCETGYFTVAQSRKILSEAQTYGMRPKIHADEFSCMGCSRLAAEVHAVSADHLLMTGDEEMKMLAESGVVATVLPATPFVLNEGYPDVNRMLRCGLSVALATDLNPNCYVTSMQFIVQLACYQMRMKPLDALKAVTLHAARALSIDGEVGSIEKGKRADIIIMDVPTHLFIPYKVGVNLVSTVIKNGKVVHSQQ